MGDDGATGLAELRRSGSWIIAEDETTAAVYGMPAAAAQIGAVSESLPLQRIAPRILQLVGPRQKTA
jgi:two-component system chemotaxis response regulator CheB